MVTISEKNKRNFDITMLGDSEEKGPRLPTRVTFDRGLGDAQETSQTVEKEEGKFFFFSDSNK